MSPTRSPANSLTTWSRLVPRGRHLVHWINNYPHSKVRTYCVCCTRSHQLLPLPQRHDAIAVACDLSDPEGLVSPRLYPDRPAHPDLSAHRLAVAAGDRNLHR